MALPVNEVLYSCNPNTGVYLDEAGCVTATWVCEAVVAPYNELDSPHNDTVPVVIGFKIIEVVVDGSGLKSLYHFKPNVAPEPPSKTSIILFSKDAILSYTKLIPTELEIIESKYKGHIEEILNTYNIEHYYCCCIMGGDGSFHEAINGLMKRIDKLKITLSLIKFFINLRWITFLNYVIKIYV